MKNGIRCNMTQYTPKSKRNRITYRFVTGDKDIPSHCTIRIGDIDPLTGEQMTEINFFRDYYRLVDHEIYITLKDKRAEYSREQKDQRKEEAHAFRDSFKAMYGYTPSRDDILYHLEQMEAYRYNISLDDMTNKEERQTTDYRNDLGYEDMDPFGTYLPDDIYMLHEVTNTLTGRKKAVYEAMLDKLDGGSGKLTNVELAHRWGVSEGQIRKDQKQIIRMIREKIKKQI